MVRTLFISEILFLVVIFVTGCKDIIQQPLMGHYKLEGHERTTSIAGIWSAEGEFGDIELNLYFDTGVNRYTFSLIEDGERYYGEAAVANYKDKMIFSIDLQTLGIRDVEGIRNIFDFNERSHALVGAYFVGESLYIIPADMDVFFKDMAEYFFISGKLSVSCNRGNKSDRNFCDLLFSDAKLLALDETGEFMESVLDGFHKIFPPEDAVVFNSKNGFRDSVWTGGSKQ